MKVTKVFSITYIMMIGVTNIQQAVFLFLFDCSKFNHRRVL